ncbi:unnamed protein product [Clonostachys rhizophaga]|uniref:Uncharacterized protein n=1 Tax=Clonostachys rhizophaga TaxID=160324 RepID=A0A9N9YFA0_9HYPO|nr:unnamed protein product [Clonostachys rhizophaga]
METTESSPGPSNSGLALPAVANSAKSVHRPSFDGKLPPKPRRSSGESANTFVKPYSTPEIDSMNTVLYANLTLNEGDTLVYVDVPSLPEDQRKKTTCGGIKPASQHFLVHSSNLFALSDSKFPQMLDNAIYQARVKRRRKPTEDLLKGVKYLLDLTPPAEGDDLVFQISELSLTPGIIKWWSAKALFGIDQELVTGHDDVCSCSSDQDSIPIPSPTLEISQDPSKKDDDGISPTFVQNIPQKMISVTIPPSVSDVIILQEKGQDTLMEPPTHYQIPDYCVIRHCHSIIRFMLMIEGVNVTLNSAARVWSMVAISKIFEAPSVIRDQVASWIMSNTTFIEVLPEEAFRIGYRLQLPDITQTAFRILVNELALEEAANGFEPGKPRSQVSVFGRRLGSPDDETVNVIQHAARAFIDRIVKQHHETVAPALFDRLNLAEWDKLRTLEHALEQEEDGSFVVVLVKLRSLMREIQKYVTSNVNSALHRCVDAYGDCSYLDKDRVLYTEPKDFKPLRDILLRLNPTQRLLCPIVPITIRNDLTKIANDVYFRQEIESLKRDMQLAIARAPRHKDFSSWGSVLERIPENVLINQLFIVKEPWFNLGKLHKDLASQLSITETWDRIKHRFQFALPLTRHMLLTLTDNEMKYLPLWAGGNDDGTGGVFEDFLPPAEMGPNGPGPAYHTGQTLLSETSSVSGSLMDEMEAMRINGSTVAGSSVARSIDVQDGISTVYRPDRVIALGSSIASESFDDGASEFDRAVWAVPAAHQDVPGLDDVDMSVPRDDDSMSDETITSFGDDFDDDFDDNFDGNIYNDSALE